MRQITPPQWEKPRPKKADGPGGKVWDVLKFNYRRAEK